jgi:predicted SAM-dependent methyltransferase
VSEGTVFLDATTPFPFDCGTFDYIYCEHMIEHISWQKGQTMLRECHRVLKPRGVMRIATPADILFVPSSATKNITAKAIETRLSVGTGILVWHPPF